MDYQGLGNVIGRKKQRQELARERMMRAAAKSKSKKDIGGVIGGGISAIGAGLATQGNPAAIIGAYQAGSEATKALMGDDNASLGNAAVTAGATTMGYKNEMKAAEAAAKKDELLAKALKKLTA
tara:strand:- start:5739 stop:6110 length:372 start_codon:yes stop_codon:yes gene_type:complete